jgi:hypothetical protein
MTKFIQYKLVRKILLFVTHPIWGYSIKQICDAVQRDSDGPIGTSARHILKYMDEQNVTKCSIHFSDSKQRFLTLECYAISPTINKENCHE